MLRHATADERSRGSTPTGPKVSCYCTSAVSSLLEPLGVPLYLPLSWDSLIERKDKIYAIFHSYMLPTTWVAAEAQSIQATSLMQDRE